MDTVQSWAEAPGSSHAVEFTGNWKEYLPIALTNLILTIVTLGIFRFWAKARERRYLWSRSRLIGDRLEWTGTGSEMFIGFLIAMGVLVGSVAFLFGGAVLLGDWFMVMGLIAFYVFILWAVGFARFRALRYRLSRTYWRGIRGGSDDNGVSYGWTALGNNFLAILTLGILTPRAIARNWNDRMRKMSFGPHMLDSNVDTVGLQWRWMMLYAVYAGFIAVLAFTATEPATGEPEIDLLGFGAVLLLMLALALVMISFWALFYNKAAGTFRMGELSADFDVSALEWLKFYAKVVGLTIVTFGLGLIMWGYWRWEFVMDRLELHGEVNLDTLTQSTTTVPKEAEGFADAFDIGAI